MVGRAAEVAVPAEDPARRERSPEISAEVPRWPTVFTEAAPEIPVEEIPVAQEIPTETPVEIGMEIPVAAEIPVAEVLAEVARRGSSDMPVSPELCVGPARSAEVTTEIRCWRT